MDPNEMSRLEDMEIDDGGVNQAVSVPRAIIGVSLGVDLLLSMINQPQGVAIWNAWVKSMDPLLNPDADEHTDPPLLFSIDCSHGNLQGLKHLDGADLDAVWMEKVDLTASSLRGAYVGFCPFAIFRDADLSNAVINGDVSGTDWTGARTDGLVFREFCTYDKGSPPIGLPPELLAQCKEVEDEPSEAFMSPVGRTIQVGGRMMVMRGGRGSVGGLYVGTMGESQILG